MITRLPLEAEVHPALFVTVYEYVPWLSGTSLYVNPVPFITTLPGLLVRIQLPADGSPESKILPFEVVHVGWVTVPVGTAGAWGAGLITTFDELEDTHPADEVTV